MLNLICLDQLPSLVVKDNVRSPDVIRWNMQHVAPAVLLGIPLQLVVLPELFHPQVGGHDLVLQVLNENVKTVVDLNICATTAISWESFSFR